MKIRFNVHVSVRRRVVVDGREYGSVEEMPADVRDAYRKALPAPGSVSPPEGPVEPRPFFSLRQFWVILGLLFLMAVCGMVYYLNLRGTR